jgi:3-oxoacyl-[acyl-carrier-protein] synthase III
MKYFRFSALLYVVSGMKADSNAFKEGMIGIQNLFESSKYEQLYLSALSSASLNRTIQEENVQLRNQNFNFAIQFKRYQQENDLQKNQIQNLGKQNQYLLQQLSLDQQEIDWLNSNSLNWTNRFLLSIPRISIKVTN